ncbi:zf-HC2 domain-containing protein [Paenibacillus chungangensis]|uniref:Anti-sigma-W factor RsiW n=1 Tax=Paenibacillus chungangensis TaxID=696535 RepID=A0ABW3HU31_9BACL
MECKVAISKIHHYLDGDSTRDEVAVLQAHMNQCPECRARFSELEKADAAVMHALEAVRPAKVYDEQASAELKQRIMQQLPPVKNRKRSGLIRMIYRYPGLTAAAVFLLVMLGSVFASWDQSTQMVVSGEDLQHVVIDGNKVIVPAGVEVTGNLTVENGIIEVEGAVSGDVTVIDGSMVLASTGHIAGQSRTIDQALDWFWYKVTSTLGSALDH